MEGTKKNPSHLLEIIKPMIILCAATEALSSNQARDVSDVENGLKGTGLSHTNILSHVFS